MARKTINRKEASEKRAASWKALQRDERNECVLGSVLIIKKGGVNQKYVIAITTQLFVYLVGRKGNYKKLSWQRWNQLICKDSVECHELMTNVKFFTPLFYKTVEDLKEKITTSMIERRSKKKKPTTKKKPARRKKNVRRSPAKRPD